MSATNERAIAVGLMSGTSLDGIAAAVAEFTVDHDGRENASLLAFHHQPYSREQRSRLEAAMLRGSAQEYCRLHVDVGAWLADAAIQVLAQADVVRGDVACIASHGQTLWHEPGHSTWQCGDAATIAERTGCTVVSDFRARDVAAGGQGAPLVPIADVMLFSSDTDWRALQNIGGIANVTVVPPCNVKQRHEAVRAFDTGPGVVVIDQVTRLLRPDLPFDIDGTLAAAGRPVTQVVDGALAHAYFREMPPKSTGRELFTREFSEQFVNNCRAHGASDADIVASAVSLTARSIAGQYARFVPEPISECLLSGGGAQNPVLVRELNAAFESVYRANNMPAPTVRRFDDIYFDGDAKEAVAFAYMGWLTLRGETANVPRATGARGTRKLGAVVFA